MVNTKLFVGLFGVFLMVLSACTQLPQQGDIAGQATGTAPGVDIQKNLFCRFGVDSTSNGRCTGVLGPSSTDATKKDVLRQARLVELDVYLQNEKGQTTQSDGDNDVNKEFISWPLVTQYSADGLCTKTGMTTYTYPTTDLNGDGTADNLNSLGENMNGPGVLNTIRIFIKKPMAGARFDKYILFKEMNYADGADTVGSRNLRKLTMVPPSVTPTATQIVAADNTGAALTPLTSLATAQNNLLFYDITGTATNQYVKLTLPIGLAAGVTKPTLTSPTFGPVDNNEVASTWMSLTTEGPTHMLFFVCACKGTDCKSTSTWTCNPPYATATGAPTEQAVATGGVPEKGISIGRWNLESALVRAELEAETVCVAGPGPI